MVADQRVLYASLLAVDDSQVVEALHHQALVYYELSWHLQKVELDFLLPELSKFIMQPLREGLNALGLHSPAQPVALIPCGRFTSLPLHAAFVTHPYTGKHVPFQETCEFTYQLNARILSHAREKAFTLPAKGPVVAIGNPRPSSQHNLCYAEQEVLAIARQARLKGRGSIKPLVAKNANLEKTITILKQITSLSMTESEFPYAHPIHWAATIMYGA